MRPGWQRTRLASGWWRREPIFGELPPSATATEHLLEDTTPPELIVNQPQQLGHMFIFEGATEISATVTINGEKVELDADGRFRKTVEIFDEGWIDIVIVAVDPSGNRTERTERVFVEVY